MRPSFKPRRYVSYPSVYHGLSRDALLRGVQPYPSSRAESSALRSIMIALRRCRSVVRLMRIDPSCYSFDNPALSKNGQRTLDGIWANVIPFRQPLQDRRVGCHPIGNERCYLRSKRPAHRCTNVSVNTPTVVTLATPLIFPSVDCVSLTRCLFNWRSIFATHISACVRSTPAIAATT